MDIGTVQAQLKLATDQWTGPLNAAVEQLTKAATAIEKLGSKTEDGAKQGARGLEEYSASARVASQMNTLLADTTRAVTTAFATFLTFEGIKDIIKETVSAAAAADTSLARLGATVAATGGRAGIAVSELREMAKTISDNTEYSHVAAEKAEQTLLKFGNLQGATFKKVLQITIDAAALTGQEVTTMAQGIGRAIEIPGQALRSLTQIGVEFTAAQRKAINDMVASGDIAGAQALLIKSLEENTRGLAEAMGNTLAGAWQRLKNSGDDLLETVGDGGLTGALKDLAKAVTGLSKESWFSGVMRDIGGVLGLVVDFYTTMGTFVKQVGLSIKLVAVLVEDGIAHLVKAATDSIAGLIDKLPAALLMSLPGLGSGIKRFGEEAAANATKSFAKAKLDIEHSMYDLASDVEKAMNRFGGKKPLADEAGAASGVPNEDTKATAAAEKYAAMIEKVTSSLKDRIAGEQAAITSIVADTASTKQAGVEMERTIALYKAAVEVKKKGMTDEQAMQALMNAGADTAVGKIRVLIETLYANIAVHKELTAQEQADAAAKKAMEEQYVRQARLRSDLDGQLRSAQQALDGAMNSGRAGAIEYSFVQEQINKALRDGIPLWSTQMSEIIATASAIAKTNQAARDYLVTVKALDDASNKLIEAQIKYDNIAKGGQGAGTQAAQSAGLKYLQDLGGGDIQAGIDKMVDDLTSGGGKFAAALSKIMIDTKAAVDKGIEGDWVEKFKSTWQQFKEARDAILDTNVTSAEGAAARSRALGVLDREFINNEVDSWGGFLNNLSSMFGGTFSKIASMYNQVASSMKAGQSAGESLPTNMGGGVGGSAGYVGAVVGIFAAMYQIGNAYLEKMKSVQYANTDTFSMTGGDVGVSQISQYGQEITNKINALVKQLGLTLGGTITDLQQIGIAVRNDGKYVAAWVKGVMIGHFANIDEAIQAALMASLAGGGVTLKGIPALVRDALKGLSEGSGVSGLNRNDAQAVSDFLSAMKEISQVAIPQSIQALHDAGIKFDDLWNTLSKVADVTPSVIQGFHDLTASIVQSIMDERDSITGRQKTEAELASQKQQEAVLFNAELAIRKADAQAQYVELQAKIANYHATASVAGGLGAVAGGIAKTANYLYSIAGAGDKALDAMFAQLDALYGLINALNNINPIDTNEIGKGGRGGGGKQANPVADFIKQQMLAVSQLGMGPFQKQMDDLKRSFQEQEKAAGKNAEEHKKLTDLLNKEAAAIRNQAREQTRSDVRSFTQQGGDLGSSILGIQDQAKKLGAELKDAFKIGAIGAAEFANKMAAIAEQAHEMQFSTLLSGAQSILLGLFQSLGMTNESAELQHTIAVASLLAADAQLKAALAMADLNQEERDAIQKLINTIDPLIPKVVADKNYGVTGGTNGTGSSIAETVNNVNNSLQQLIDAFHKAKDDIRTFLEGLARGSEGLVSPQDALNAAQQQYNAMIASAQRGELSGFQGAPDAARNLIEALKSYSPALAAVDLPQIQEQLASLLSSQTVRDGNVTYTERFVQGQDTMNRTLEDGFNGLSATGNIQAARLGQAVDKLSDISGSLGQIASAQGRSGNGFTGERRPVG